MTSHDKVAAVADAASGVGRALGLKSRFLNLGPKFADTVDRHHHLQLEPNVREALTERQIYLLWFTLGYGIVGQLKVQ